MMFASTVISVASFALLASAQVISDSGKSGPDLELVHLYYDEWPTGIAVSSTGRMFSNYPGGLDANDTYRGVPGKYTIAELFSNNTEQPFPSAEINSPPGGAINYTTNPPTGANYADYFIGSQSIVIDSLDRAWVLDTGRVLTTNGTLVTSTYGGPKLVGIDLTTNTVIQTILFPQTVAYPDSYLNDVRFDLRPNITASGKGVAYITDSSSEGRNGIIIVDLGTEESWRHLDGNPTVHPERQFVTYIWGEPVYGFTPGKPLSYLNFGSDGIALSADGATLYWKAVSTRYLYSIPTARLLDRGTFSEVAAQSSIVNLGETGVTDGMETDTNGYIYHGVTEQNAVGFFNPANFTDTVYVRDPRINWVDTMSIATDGYLYFTSNQLTLGPLTWPGTDRRQKPFALFRFKLPDGGTKVSLC